MGRYEYDDFWVEFAPRAGGDYDVTVRAPGGETAAETFHLPFTADELTSAVRTIGYTRSARDIGDVAVDPRLSAEQFGDRLAKALLEGPVRSLYIKARNAAVSSDRGLRMWLSLREAPGLMSVPWEFMYLQPTFLASQRKTPIVRFLQTDAPVQPRHIESSVDMLGVIASPTDLPALDVEEERKRVDDALAKVRETRQVNITWLDPATPKALRQALQQGDYHILHFVGHSGFVGDEEAAVQAVTGAGITETDAGGVIYLENDDRTKAPISDAQLVNLLGDLNLRLVVLNSCEGARSNALDPFAGIATSIVGLGIPAVLAMQFEISDKAAIAFADELYESLIVREEPIDVAVAEARKAVFTEVNQTEWATPVLFLRNADGKIFDFGPAVVVPPKRDEDDTKPKRDDPPPPKTIWERVRELPAAVLVAAIAGLGAVGLLGGLAAAGAIGGGGASQSPAASTAVVSPSPTTTTEPTVLPTATTPPTSPPTVPPTAPTVILTVPGTDEWAGPRKKSNLLGVAGGSTAATNISTVAIPKPGATARPGGEATTKKNVIDSNPAWDPNRSVLGFTRTEGQTSDVRYVVPGVGKDPRTGAVDAGITVKDPLQDPKTAATSDHLPAWRRDGSLVFARTRGCPAGPDCIEDVVVATFDRIGDFIVVSEAQPALISDNWLPVRSIDTDPRGGDTVLVVGRNITLGPTGAWLVAPGGTPRQLPGSDRVSQAIFGLDGSIVGIEPGLFRVVPFPSFAPFVPIQPIGRSSTVQAGVVVEDAPIAGPTLLVWSSPDVEPVRISVQKMVDAFGREGAAALKGLGEIRAIARSPLDDGRYAALLSDPQEATTGTAPAIVLLDHDFAITQLVPARPPKGQTWKTLIDLGW